ncbi:hypothetical protein AGLY_017513 [Aphis glycines]|uniref:Uncharacterized protein n=1 Tax=Aphis glycines TaxID=307491 RepID=A0A6G0SVW0_APHGL|nr:hypothetical protein AGLY_017513 [Aphis glycines]
MSLLGSHKIRMSNNSSYKDHLLTRFLFVLIDRMLCQLLKISIIVTYKSRNCEEQIICKGIYISLKCLTIRTYQFIGYKFVSNEYQLIYKNFKCNFLQFLTFFQLYCNFVDCCHFQYNFMFNLWLCQALMVVTRDGLFDHRRRRAILGFFHSNNAINFITFLVQQRLSPTYKQ